MDSRDSRDSRHSRDFRDSKDSRAFAVDVAKLREQFRAKPPERNSCKFYYIILQKNVANTPFNILVS